jgi:serine acetyltransferase
MTYLLVRQFVADARFYRGLTRAGRSGSVALIRTMLCNRGLWLLTFHRIAHNCLIQRRVRSPMWWFARLCQSVGTCFNVLFCRSAFRNDCNISGAVYLSNRGYLMCGARGIGAGSLIHERCTFGYTVAGGREGRPHIGERVWIGPDCIIAGSLTVGDGATVLPGSFLTFSVPPRAVVKGNPALIVRTNFENSALLRSLAVVQDVTPDNS